MRRPFKIVEILFLDLPQHLLQRPQQFLRCIRLRQLVVNDKNQLTIAFRKFVPLFGRERISERNRGSVNFERRSFSQLAINIDKSAVTLDDACDGRKSKPRSCISHRNYDVRSCFRFGMHARVMFVEFDVLCG